MNKEEFNKYCAEVMGHEIDYWNSECNNGVGSYKTKHGYRLYNPYDDLNQMSEVAEKLFDNILYAQRYQEYMFADCEERLSIKQAMRDFIESTKEE